MTELPIIYYVLIKILCRTELILHFTQTYRPIPFIVWPALYFYIKIMTNPSLRFHLKDSIHLLPFGLYVLFLFPFFLSDASVKLQSATSPVPFHYILAVLLQIFYVTLSHRILCKHRQRIKNMFSNLEKVKLDWLKNLMIAFVTISTWPYISRYLHIEGTADNRR